MFSKQNKRFSSPRRLTLWRKTLRIIPGTFLSFSVSWLSLTSFSVATTNTKNNELKMLFQFQSIIHRLSLFIIEQATNLSCFVKKIAWRSSRSLSIFSRRNVCRWPAAHYERHCLGHQTSFAVETCPSARPNKTPYNCFICWKSFGIFDRILLFSSRA